MVARIKNLDGVVSIYQIGSVSNPGISDIDMMVVFEDDTVQKADPVRDFQTDQYLFTHQIYGVPSKYWSELRQLTFFHNYKFIWGEEMEEGEIDLSKENEESLKRQIALEFLIKMYAVLLVQRKYDILKLRSFLLEGKALIYDLEFLGIDSGKLHQLVKKIIDWRVEWFVQQPSLKEVRDLVNELYLVLEQFLKAEFERGLFYLPTSDSIQLSRNMTVKNDRFQGSSSGFTFPSFGLLNERKHFNLLNRFNKFEISFPYKLPEEDSVLAKRFKLLSELRAYNSKHLPGFLIPASSLKVI